MLLNDLYTFHKIIFKIKLNFAFGKALGNLSVYLLFASTCKAYTVCTLMALQKLGLLAVLNNNKQKFLPKLLNLKEKLKKGYKSNANIRCFLSLNFQNNKI